MTDDMIERVARAIWIAETDLVWDIEDLRETHDEMLVDWKYFESAAIAAIEAYTAYLADNGLVVAPRQPTGKMFAAGMSESEEGYGLTDIYKAMINASQEGEGHDTQD